MILDFNKEYSLGNLQSFCRNHFIRRDVLIHGVGPSTAKVICLECKYACKFKVIDRAYCKLHWVQIDAGKIIVWMFENSTLINKIYSEDFWADAHPGNISIPKSIIKFPMDSNDIAQFNIAKDISNVVEKLLVLL